MELLILVIAVIAFVFYNKIQPMHEHRERADAAIQARLDKQDKRIESFRRDS